ncbi:MAG: hypothetical protein AB8I08_36370 [Sandaracinaceae bacterium]
MTTTNALSFLCLLLLMGCAPTAEADSGRAGGDHAGAERGAMPPLAACWVGAVDAARAGLADGDWVGALLIDGVRASAEIRHADGTSSAIQLQRSLPYEADSVTWEMSPSTPNPDGTLERLRLARDAMGGLPYGASVVQLTERADGSIGVVYLTRYAGEFEIYEARGQVVERSEGRRLLVDRTSVSR